MAVKHGIQAAAYALAMTGVFATAVAQETAHRFAPLTEDKMTAEQKAMPAVKKALAAGTYNPNGYDAVMLRNPGLQEAMSAVVAEVRSGAGPSVGESKDQPTVPRGLVEIGVLMLAHNWDFPAMFKSHGPAAVKAGISQEIVDGLAQGKRPVHMKADEEAVYNFSAELIGKHEVSDDTFNTLRRYLSERDIVDLVTTVGMYSSSLMMLKVANINSH
jgi:4-carboxymuconolactone decarboxylase